MFPIRDTIPSQRTPWMTWALIAANGAVFLYEMALPEEALEGLFYLFGIVPATVLGSGAAVAADLPTGSIWAFLTSMFLHGGLLHLLSNMWMLWIFGDNVEDRMGPWRFLAFYLLTGLAAGLTHWLTNLGSTVPTVGASGAIAGVLGAYLVLFPQSRILTLIPILFWPLFVEIRAFFYLGFWFLLQLWSGALATAGADGAGGIAWWAHVGGFVAGLALFRLFLRPPPDALPARHMILESPPARPERFRRR